jgi:hypothetical protein
VLWAAGVAVDPPTAHAVEQRTVGVLDAHRAQPPDAQKPLFRQRPGGRVGQKNGHLPQVREEHELRLRMSVCVTTA